jgi:hypothetical protein
MREIAAVDSMHTGSHPGTLGGPKDTGAVKGDHPLDDFLSDLDTWRVLSMVTLGRVRTLSTHGQ